MRRLVANKFVEVEFVGVMVEVDDRAIRDFGACDHRKAFQHRGLIALVAYPAIFMLLR
jgi:hypothetical protein